MVDNKTKLKVIFVEAGCAGGSVNRLFKLLEKWDFANYPAGIFTFYQNKKAQQLLDISGPTFAKTLGLKECSFPDPLFNWLGLTLPTLFGIRYFLRSFVTMLVHKSAYVYINNTPYSHMPLIVAAKILNRKIICHLRDTIELSRLEKKLSKYVDMFISLSQAARVHYIEQGLPADKIRVVYDSIDAGAYAKTSNMLTDCRDDKAIKIAVVGSLNYRKAQDICVKALALIRDHCENVVLMLVGDGESKEQLLEMVTKFELNDRVIFEGHSENIPEILHRSDIGVLTSRREGMPNSVMEYMAAGLPVVVSELPGIRELVVDKVTGYVISQESHEELADSLLELIRNAELRGKMGKAGVTRIMSETFAPETELQDIVDILSR